MTLSEPIIRPLRVEDAADSYEIRTQPQVIWGTLQLPTLSLDDVRAQLTAAPDVHRLGAEVDGRVVATVNLRVGCGMQRHTGTLGIVVHDAYQGRGLGRRLMAAALDLADNWLGLHRVELDVYPDNERAIRLYHTFGFEDEGISRADVMRDGALVDVLHMGRVRPQPAAAPERTAAPKEKGAPLQGLKVRGARPEDVRPICRLLRHPAVQAGLGRLPSLHDDEVRKEYCPIPRNNHVFVAELAGEVIGFAHLLQLHGRRNHVGSIEAIAVDPAWHGRGVGSALLGATVDLGARWIGLRRLQARIQVPDQAALALFEQHGFAVEVTHREAFLRAGRFTDAVIVGRIQ